MFLGPSYYSLKDEAHILKCSQVVTPSVGKAEVKMLICRGHCVAVMCVPSSSDLSLVGRYKKIAEEVIRKSAFRADVKQFHCCARRHRPQLVGTASRLGWPAILEARVRGGGYSSGTRLASAPISACWNHCFGVRYLHPSSRSERTSCTRRICLVPSTGITLEFDLS